MTLIVHHTNNTEQKCACCGQLKENVTELQNLDLLTFQASDIGELHTNIFLCQSCVNWIYAHTCHAFNVRPAKLF